jgi:hypothetical protein
VTPKSELGFVVSPDSSTLSPKFEYDADAQMLTVVLHGSTEDFTLDSLDQGKLALDSIRIRITSRQDSYVGGNAFGASVKVTRTIHNEFGVAFDQANWLLHSWGNGRRFNYILPLGVDAAKALKPGGRFLFVCRLAEPWVRHNFHHYPATIGDPAEVSVDGTFLQVVPDALWIVNSRTGDVVRKLSALSLAAEAAQ